MENVDDVPPDYRLTITALFCSDGYAGPWPYPDETGAFPEEDDDDGSCPKDLDYTSSESIIEDEQKNKSEMRSENNEEDDEEKQECSYDTFFLEDNSYFCYERPRHSLI